LPEKRIFSKLCRQYHPRSTKKLFRTLHLGNVRVCKLLSICCRIQVLIFDEICMVRGDEVVNDLVRLYAKSLNTRQSGKYPLL
jgi:hypothetical protein